MAEEKVPPIDEQKAEQAAAPQHEAIQLVDAKGMETSAPIWRFYGVGEMMR